jgi:hypothetical protein
VAAPVVACSSRPHSPVNDRTRAPLSRSETSISFARSDQSLPDLGAASALTESLPSGRARWTACMGPPVAAGSLVSDAPSGSSRRSDPKSVAPDGARSSVPPASLS